MSNNDLKPLEPREGVEWFLESRRTEYAESTIQTQEYRLQRFLEYCHEKEIDNLNEVDARTVQRFRNSRKDDSLQYLKGILDTLRVFLRWAENMDSVSEGVSQTIESPTLTGSRGTSDEMLEPERAEAILAYLSKYEYASRNHSLLRFMWDLGVRICGVRAVDLQDLNLSEQYVEFRHRPDTGTPLKNDEASERVASLSSETADIIEDYIDHDREDTTDEYGREPLFTTRYGRVSKATVRYTIYRITRPCYYGRECPHDRDPDECDATQGRDSWSKCPDSRSPHPVRTGAITHYLREDAPTRAVSDRMDVSETVLDKHYDQRTEREQMEQRREFFE